MTQRSVPHSVPHSVPPLYFESLYQSSPDPWNYQTSEYELSKYSATVAALPKQQYQAALEIGGSIGVLTKQLAARCTDLLSIDVSPSAQQRAKQRCRHLPQVRFELMQVPQQFPAQQFDLIVISEVGYYLSAFDLQSLRQQVETHLLLGGQLLLVHWLNCADDFCLSGDQVHECFLASDVFHPVLSQKSEQYRLDLLETA